MSILNTIKKQQSQLESIIINNPIIKDYFDQYVTSRNYLKVIQELLVDAIVSRNKQKKIYNIAYVKHSRFMSPLQKKNVLTPKVTEIIPIKQPHVIYGKPKIRVDNSQPYNQPLNKQFNSIEEYKIGKSPSQQINSQIIDQEPYLKSTLKHVQSQTNILKKDKNIQTLQSKQQQIQVSQKKIGEIRQKNNTKKYQNKYKNVQSKIKHQVERDKRQKRLQLQLIKQKQRIQKLEKRQNTLILAQSPRTNQYHRQPQYHHDDQSSTSSQKSSSCSSIDSQLIRKYEQFKRQRNYYHEKDYHQNKYHNSDSFSCSCSRTLNNESEDNQFSKFDVKEFLSNQTPKC